ncbi:MAG TPA: hypothetical protein VFT22_18470, partial [Kofleriaceae bacterium]|nr:hypothetical protein [Kofleriaceae bacterium]
WDTIRREKARGTTIVLTTHYLDEAEQLSDRVAFIKAGAIVAQGTLADLHHSMGKSVRVTEYDAEGGAAAHHFFDSFKDARTAIASRGLEQYAVSKVSLEDIYLRFFGTADAARAEER